MSKTFSPRQNRLPGYDYSRSGYYYVTILTNCRKQIFGAVENNKIVMNEYGKIAEKIWQGIPMHFPYAKLDEYIIMPNHIHGIICVTNADLRSLQNNNDQTKMILSKIIHGFKSTVTRKINEINGSRQSIWQKSYHDHIIRNDKSLNKIRDYIRTNPATGDRDTM